jgi:carbon monoxide dehydrogenase subunit G
MRRNTPIFTIYSILFSCCLFHAPVCSAIDSKEPSSDSDIFVQTSKPDDDLVVDVALTVAASPKEVWAVLTDFDNMAKFLENIEESWTIEANGNKVIIFQRGKAWLGPFFSSYESKREIELTPMSEIRSRVISGNIKKSDGVITLEAKGQITKIVYHAETTPNIIFPFWIAKSAIEKQIRSQFQEVRTEILRRRNSKGSASQ